MSQILLRLLLAVLISTSAGCGMFGKNKKPKSSVHIYEGEGPSIRYSDEPETAGGALSPY